MSIRRRTGYLTVLCVAGYPLNRPGSLISDNTMNQPFSQFLPQGSPGFMEKWLVHKADFPVLNPGLCFLSNKISELCGSRPTAIVTVF